MRNLPSNKTLYLGLDGGQSETFAVICDGGGGILGTGRSGRCVFGGTICADNIAGAVSGAISDASLPPGIVFNSAVFGLSGGFEDIRINDYAAVMSGRAVWDAETALVGAAGGIPPVGSALVIAGTGSVSIGVRADGSYSRCGGWGYVIGDPGSGCDVGRRTFEAAARDFDGRGEHTALTELLCAYFGVIDLMAMKKAVYKSDPLLFFPPLASLCDKACGLGDSVALDIEREAGAELAALVAGLINKGGLSENCSVYRAGGVFKSPFISDAFEDCLLKTLRGAVLRDNQFPPCLGAILMAAGEDGADTPNFRHTLRREADIRDLKGDYKRGNGSKK